MADLIDRQAAIDATWEEPSYTDPINVLTEVRDRIKKLPSARPERKQGRWIKEENRGQLHRCSACGNFLDFRGVNAGRGNANFCPNCGADMRKDEEHDE